MAQSLTSFLLDQIFEDILIMMDYGGWTGRYCAANAVIMVADIASQDRVLLQPRITLDRQGPFHNESGDINAVKYQD